MKPKGSATAVCSIITPVTRLYDSHLNCKAACTRSHHQHAWSLKCSHGCKHLMERAMYDSGNVWVMLHFYSVKISKMKNPSSISRRRADQHYRPLLQWHFEPSSELKTFSATSPGGRWCWAAWNPRDSLSFVTSNSLKQPVLGSPRATVALMRCRQWNGGCWKNHPGDNK